MRAGLSLEGDFSDGSAHRHENVTHHCVQVVAQLPQAVGCRSLYRHLNDWQSTWIQWTMLCLSMTGRSTSKVYLVAFTLRGGVAAGKSCTTNFSVAHIVYGRNVYEHLLVRWMGKWLSNFTELGMYKERMWIRVRCVLIQGCGVAFIYLLMD